MAALLALAVDGCGRCSAPTPAAAPTPPRATTVRDAARADALPADANGLASRLDHLAPPYPPPPAVIRKHAHGDCRTSYAPRPDRDPNPMCKIKGGTFMMGGGPYAPDPKPHPVTVGDFYIDQFEVTIQQAVLFLNAHGNKCPGLDKKPTSGNYDIGRFCIADVGDEHGVGYVGFVEHDGHFEVKPGWGLTAETLFSFEGAMDYCAWVGKQVPTSAQWEYAARHDPRTGKDLIYPWGDTWLRNHAACWECIDRATPDEMPQVGMYDGTRGRSDGSSPWGVHDMAGGADELVFACADPMRTCRPGEPCPCRTLISPGDAETTAKLVTSSRAVLDRVGSQGVRCVVVPGGPLNGPSQPAR